MKIKSQRDFWSGLMFLVTGVVCALGATGYAMGNAARPGPGYFPLLLAVLLAILGAVVMFKALVIESEEGDPIGRFAWRPLVVVIASIALFSVLVERVGLVATVPVVVVTSGLAAGDLRWRGLVTSAVVLTLLCWLVFVLGVKLAVPVWPPFLR